MAISISYSTVIAGGGVTIQSQTVVRTGSAGVSLDDTLVNAQAGVLSTRTDDDTGTITMDSGSHTIATADVVDVYWAGGVQYGVTVGTVAGTSVPIDLGDGDVLPIATTAITIVPQLSANVAIDGDNAKIITVILETTNKSLRTAGHIQFLDVSSAEIAEIDLVANVPQVWDIEGGSANPFTGNPITSVKASNANVSTDQVYTIKVVGVADASP